MKDQCTTKKTNKKEPIVTTTKTNHPDKYTKELATTLCARIATGESLNHISQDPAMPHKTTIQKWLLEKAPFANQYTRAKEQLADQYAEEIIEIADTADDSSTASLAKAKLQLDTRKWLAARLKPQKYSDKTNSESTDTDNSVPRQQTIDLSQITDEQLAKLETIARTSNHQSHRTRKSKA